MKRRWRTAQNTAHYQLYQMAGEDWTPVDLFLWIVFFFIYTPQAWRRS